MADVFRRILYPAFVLTIVATVWAMAEAKIATDAAARTYWAPLHPSLTGVPEFVHYDFAPDNFAPGLDFAPGVDFAPEVRLEVETVIEPHDMAAAPQEPW